MLNLQTIEYIIIYFIIIINCKNSNSVIDSLIYLISFIPFLFIKNDKYESKKDNIPSKQLLLPSILLIPILFSIVRNYNNEIGTALFFGCIAILFCFTYIDSMVYQLVIYSICVLFQYLFYSVSLYYSIAFIFHFHLFYYLLQHANFNLKLDEIFTNSFLLSFYISANIKTDASYWFLVFIELKLYFNVMIYLQSVKVKNITILGYLILVIPFTIIDKVWFLLYNILNFEEYRYVMAYWIILIFLMLFIHPTTDSTRIHNIIVRKFYHILTIILFLPVIHKEIKFMSYSFSVCLYLFVMIELLRYEEIYPFTLINDYIGSYIDERDRNRFVVTPIYLLLGNALPVYLALYFSIDKDNNYMKIIEYGGILTLGIEDTFAAIFGILYGKHKIFNTKKSYEGLMGGFICMFLSGLCILKFLLNVELSVVELMKIIFIFGLSSIYESVTSQIDNLYLPLFFIVLVMVI